MDVEPERPGERERPLEQGHRSMLVAARKRAAARRGEPLRCAFGKDSVRLLELRLVASCLFKVVAEDFVELDQIRAPFFEPAGEAFVQVGADSLGHGVVGSVADQKMAEAEGLLACELRCVGPDELLTHERD